MFVSLYFMYGTQTIYSCYDFSYVPNLEESDKFTLEMQTSRGFVRRDLRKSEVTIFVMNGEGKTIQKLFSDKFDKDS